MGGTGDDLSSIADPSETAYLEPIQRIKAQVDTAASIEIISQMPPSWNPFF